MKTQISRDNYNQDKRYSGVYQQQGRMLTDADWNELVDILKGELRQALQDIVGSGVPEGEGAKIVQLSGHIEPYIIPGKIYADGLEAEIHYSKDATFESDPVSGKDSFSYTKQADFPDPPTPVSWKDCILYADIWDRVVNSLEDDNLRDPGLNGADTCSRTQRMAQVKYCPGELDPTDVRINPQKGNARLTLKLRQANVDPDPCEPCSENLSLDSDVGNYLFRVEIAEIEGDPNAPTAITFKWSSENAAEQYLYAPGSQPQDMRPPDEFGGSGWLYELYNDAMEKHLGVHLMGYQKIKKSKYLTALPPNPDPGYSYVRRWDGYCLIEKKSGIWELKKDNGKVIGNDKGVTLSTTYNSNANGYVFIDQSSILINLQNITLTLDLDRTMVPGDYWLAPVRRNIHHVGNTILNSEEPQGILHHYVKLARIDPEGTLLEPTDAEKRRLNFPPLTNLMAKDVGIVNSCKQLYQNAQNVQEALDSLCKETSELDLVGAVVPFAISPELIPTEFPDKEYTDLKSKINDNSDLAIINLYTQSNNKFILDRNIPPDDPIRLEIAKVLNKHGFGLPKGWLRCDGSRIGKDEFKELYGRIGDDFTPQEERNRPTFRLPDLGGKFIRGCDQQFRCIAGRANEEEEHEPQRLPRGDVYRIVDLVYCIKF